MIHVGSTRFPESGGFDVDLESALLEGGSEDRAT